MGTVFDWASREDCLVNWRMEVRWMWRALWMGVLMSVLLSCGEGNAATVLKAGQTPAAALEAVSDTAESLIQRMGWKKEEVKLGNIDTRDAKIGQTLIYEFDIQVGDNVVPLRLSEEIVAWQYLQELPAPASDSEEKDGEDGIGKGGAVDVWQPEAFSATLAPFQVAGPVDLWIQDAQELRLSMPHDVDAGVLKRVLLADGAVVTVEGAREVSLSRPLQLPLPLTRGPQESAVAASLVALAARLRSASRGEEKPLLSLRIVGPSSFTAVATESETSGGRLKVKRLGSGAVELRSQVAKQGVAEPVAGPYDSLRLADNDDGLWMWPLPSLNMSKLEGLEQALIKTLGPKAYKRGSFQLLNAKVSAASFVQIQFELEKTLTEEAFDDAEHWPKWATKPTVERLQFELLAKVDGNRLLPVRAEHLKPVLQTISYSSNVMTGNLTMKAPTILMPPGAMTLDVDLEGIVD